LSAFLSKKKIRKNFYEIYPAFAGHLRKTREFAAMNIVVNQRLSTSTVMHAIVKLKNKTGEGIQTSEQSGLNIPVLVPLNMRLEEK
jgi:hypothetical protein